MPQQPKITDDAEVDSWSLQVTQELNDLTGLPTGSALPTSARVGAIFHLTGQTDTTLNNLYRYNGTVWELLGGGGGVAFASVLPRVTDGEIGELVSLILADGDYGADVYRRIANNGNLEDWDRVGRADAPVPVVFPEPATLTERVTYRLGFTAGQIGTGRGNVVGFSSGNNLIGFDYGSLGTTNMPAVGTPADTSANTYVGSNIADIPAGGQVDFSSINLSLPTAAQWADLRGATAGAATNLSWAFWTGTGGTNRGTQLGFRIPHPALIAETNPISPASWPARFPYTPIVAAAGSIRVRIVGIDDPTYSVTINYTPSTALPWNTYNSDNTVSHVQSNRGDRVVTPSGTTGGITFSPSRAHSPFVSGHRYDVFVTVNGTFDAAGHNFQAPMLAENRQGTWTPTPANASATFSNARGEYIRDGDLVNIWATLAVDSNNITAPFTINGIPFTRSTTRGNTAGLTYNLSRVIAEVGGTNPFTVLNVYPQFTGSSIGMRGNILPSNVTGGQLDTNLTVSALTYSQLSGITLQIHGTYITEDP